LAIEREQMIGIAHAERERLGRTMQYAPAVGIRERAADRTEHVQNFIKRERRFETALFEGLTRHIFHDQIGLALKFVKVVHRRVEFIGIFHMNGVPAAATLVKVGREELDPRLGYTDQGTGQRRKQTLRSHPEQITGLGAIDAGQRFGLRTGIGLEKCQGVA